MGRAHSPYWRVTAAIILLGAMAPLLLYWLIIDRAPSVSPAQAEQLLRDPAALLVDVGVEPALAGALPPTLRWPLASVLQLRSPAEMPLQLRQRQLLLICSGGIRSAQAASHLHRLGLADVFSVRGGAQEWIATASTRLPGALLRPDPNSDKNIPAFRPSPVPEQWAVVLAFFGVKLLYSLLAAAIVIVLWRRTETDLAALRRAMICFFVGEAFCFINVMVFFERSLLLEHLHSLGMVLSFAYAAFALLEGIDRRLLHYSDPAPCAAAALCRGCIKHADVGCGLRRLFLLLIPAAALTAAIPLSSALRPQAYNTRIFGVLHAYAHPVIHQLYELRYLPIAAILLLTACFLVLWLSERHPVRWSKMLFCAALGAMGFSLLRLMLVAPFADNQVWFATWEELTELLYVGVVGGVLIVFPRGLLGLPPALAPAGREGP